VRHPASVASLCMPDAGASKARGGTTASCQNRRMDVGQWRVPARIETQRLVLRCYTPEDVEAMDVVVPANKEHLETYLPWARDEPIGHEKRTELVSDFVAKFRAREDFVMGIFDRATGEYIGGTGLHTRQGPGVLEIGYWLAAHRQGEGLITEAAAALTRTAFSYAHAPRVEIHCEPTNVRSRNVPLRLGFVLEDTRVAPCGSDRREELNEFWVLNRENFADSAASAAPRPAIFDAQGSRLAWVE
jgi:RimJ/RimL family protein N-acetyltransferase